MFGIARRSKDIHSSLIGLSFANLQKSMVRKNAHGDYNLQYMRLYQEGTFTCVNQANIMKSSDHEGPFALSTPIIIPNRYIVPILEPCNQCNPNVLVEQVRKHHQWRGTPLLDLYMDRRFESIAVLILKHCRHTFFCVNLASPTGATCTTLHAFYMFCQA